MTFSMTTVTIRRKVLHTLQIHAQNFGQTVLESWNLIYMP